MKKLLFSILILTGSFTYAQVEEEETNTEEETTTEESTEKSEPQDTTRFKVGGVEFIIIDHDTIPSGKAKHEHNAHFDVHPNRRALTYWDGFNVGINVLMNDHKEIDQFNSQHLQIDPANSFSFSFNFLEQRIRIVKDYFGIVTGMGFTNSRYGFKDDHLRLASTPDSTFGMIDSSLISGFTRNQLRVNYFNVPLLFHINTSKNPRKNFHVAFGAIGSVRMNSNTKYVYEQLTGEAKDKIKGRYNLNPFQVCATARIGYRNFGVFANYHFLSLYEKGKSDIAYPLTFGMSFHM